MMQPFGNLFGILVLMLAVSTPGHAVTGKPMRMYGKWIMQLNADHNLYNSPYVRITFQTIGFYERDIKAPQIEDKYQKTIHNAKATIGVYRVTYCHTDLAPALGLMGLWMMFNDGENDILILSDNLMFQSVENLIDLSSLDFNYLLKFHNDKQIGGTAPGSRVATVYDSNAEFYDVFYLFPERIKKARSHDEL